MRESNTPYLEEKGKVKKNSQFEKIVKVSILIGISVVTGFIIYYSLTPEPGYVYFGVLQNGEELENYTIEAKLKILKGNNNTILYPGPSNGTLFYNFENTTLVNEHTWVSNIVNISFNETGANHIVIIELWEIKSEIEYFFNILWIRLNITLS